jgi:hypothetical protein
MKNYRITYRPFGTSTVEASDVVIPAQNEQEAKMEFQLHYSAYFFVSAKEEI